jgi:hypothetical protein
MRLIAVGCLLERMECEPGIIYQYIDLAVVTLLNYKNLLQHDFRVCS